MTTDELATLLGLAVEKLKDIRQTDRECQLIVSFGVGADGLCRKAEKLAKDLAPIQMFGNHVAVMLRNRNILIDRHLQACCKIWTEELGHG